MANVFKVCVLFLVHVLCCFPWLLLSYNFCQKRGCPLCLRVATAATSPPPLPCDLIKAVGRKPRSYLTTLYCVGANTSSLSLSGSSKDVRAVLLDPHAN